MELASSLVEGANEDLIDLIYKFIKHTLQVVPLARNPSLI